MPRNNLNLLTLDFETYYDTKYSLTKMTTMEYVGHELFKIWGVGIKFDEEIAEWYSYDELDVLNEIDWDNTALLCHNALFDAYILNRKFGIKPAYFLDTAAMSRGLYPGQSAHLKDVAMRLFPGDESMRKGEELVNVKGIYDLLPEQEEALAGYCIQDVELTYHIYNKMQYPKSELDLIDMTTRMFCVPQIKLNVGLVQQTLATEKEARLSKLEAAGIDQKVLASNQQFAAYLEEQGYTVPIKPSPSNPDTKIPAFGKNDKQFKKFRKNNPELETILDAREAVKSRIGETRAQSFLNAVHENGDFPVPLRYYAAHTGRFGGTDKINLQNLPRRSPLRKALTAPVDHYIYVADLSNIESRMLAWFAEQENLLAQYAAGEDIYCNFASKIYNREITKADTLERFVGKTAVLGLGYGMGAQKFATTLASGAGGPIVTLESGEASDIVNQYRTLYSDIEQLWYRTGRWLSEATSLMYDRQSPHACASTQYKNTIQVGPGSISLPNGLALVYKDLMKLGENNYRFQGRNGPEYTYGGKITENIIQALSRIVITDAMLRIQKIEDMQVVLTVHDEIVCIGPKSDADSRFNAIMEAMCTAPSWAPDLPLAAEGGYDVCYSK